MAVLQRLKKWWFGTSATRAFPGDPEIGADVPIRTAKQDLLRRVGYAERIAIILSELSLDEGRVFAIRGPWGAGKSSLKNLVVEQLKNGSKRADWLEFNPWQWGDGDAIATALFQQIADKLGGPLSGPSRARGAKFRKYGAILTGSGATIKKTGGDAQLITGVLTNASVVALAASIGWSLPAVATIAGLLAILGVAVPLLGRLLAYAGRDRWTGPLDEIRAALESSLRELDRPLVVFVDDIDRLEQEQIRLLIRQIKVNANLPNIVFVLIFQSSIVEAALDPIANNQGKEFLKKIIHANFDLPAVARSSVHKVMTSELDRIVGSYAKEENGFEGVRWGNALVGAIQPHINNLRDARRYVSSVATHTPLHVGAKLLEVNIIDFLTLEALRAFEPALHSALFGERDLLLKKGRYQGDTEREASSARLNDLLGKVSEHNRDAAESAIKLLFPRAEEAFGGMGYGNDWLASWSASRRVCSARYFSRYFELQTPPDDLSENEFDELLSIAGDKKKLEAFLESVEQRELLGSLAGRMDEAVARLPIEAAPVLLPAMYAFAQKLAAHDGESFSSPWTSAWRSISWYLDRLPTDTRGELAIAAFEQTKALSVGATIIYLNDPSALSKQSKIEPKLNKSTVDLLKEAWLQEIRNRAKDTPEMLRYGDLGYYLYRWKEYSGSIDEPKEWVDNAVKSDAHFVDFIAQLMSTGSSHTMGDLVSSRVDIISWEAVDDFIGSEAAAKRMKQIQVGGLEAKQARAMAALRRCLEEGPRYSRDDDESKS
ncbi:MULTISPECIES: KAP family P-loop NTPase fold protein [unclassified Rhizobium]|uniref:KAP family P-loop NTPase fold protein n=1 Tax=unclassified Rhizobium TaxID=2613769 RepID=UPI001ADD07D3|nr:MULTISPECIES: P-loop NTPase fold protein [unclassified Rhizobium]MBO9101779.1 NTPase [Rhizobium sp. L58/93]MBO9171950.1 NTPase [Rhizobium sp. L245/93]MBO9187811.1 NTPase [Rhizobium sp. E27B/91]QXZ87756.1 NTPase [Rhizobium sp. K1/93]QXZ93795.1 NTPase [Rhizobium sp. K15/93]